MPVGDVNSTERGSGARFNDGKPDLSLIPPAFLRNKGGEHGALLTSLSFLYHKGDDDALRLWFKTKMAEPEVQNITAKVFEFGKQKYAAHNWMKGMAWSVPLACACRHADKLWFEGEELDKDSGLHHIGHIMANVIMLLEYRFTFPEGNDLPYKVLNANV